MPDDCDSEQEARFGIPAFARCWTTDSQVALAVRRPSQLPDPQSYHEAVEPLAIFELDERQQDGSIRPILVVPFGCTRCRLSKQACSRAQPTCARCLTSGQRCTAIQGGYQRLPGPKVPKPRRAKPQMSEAQEHSLADSPSHNPRSMLTDGLSRAKRKKISEDTLCTSVTLNVSGSKRRLSPGPDEGPPRKKKRHTKSTWRDESKAQSNAVTESQDSNMNLPAQSVVVPADDRNALKWVFVKNARGWPKTSSCAQEPVDSARPSTRFPRVWANSISGLLAVFPELAKAPAGFSWSQADTPILLLDTNYARGRWINSTTIAIDLLWEFSCRDVDLEPIAAVEIGNHAQFQSSQPAIGSFKDAFHNVADTMAQQYLPPSTGSLPARASGAVPIPTLDLSALGSTLQHEQDICNHEDHFEPRTPVLGATYDPSSAHIPLHLLSPLTPVDSSPTVSLFASAPVGSADGSLPSVICASSPPVPTNTPLSYHLRATPIEPVISRALLEMRAQARVPLIKPLEVETLSDFHVRSFPLQLWLSHHSELVPCRLPPEYAYLCMGLFFISDLHHTVETKAGSTPEVVQGQVCWTVTLRWAPGGEELLFNGGEVAPPDDVPDSTPSEDTRDLLRPWWFVPTDTLPQAENTTDEHSKDLRMLFNFLPLDFLADFHPGESFPLGWFCTSCGMINAQEHFRHQMCRSTMCDAMREKRIPQGKVEPLSSLRDLYQSNSIARPINKIPSAVTSNSIVWDDGMHSWVYDIKDGVKVCHVFTGNHGHLQGDANVLLEQIQGDILLLKESASSPYFTHTTKVLHPSDGSGATVPQGTPDCIRLAYYSLRDFVRRYGQMHVPEFGSVHIQAWAKPGSRKGGMFCATKSPVIVHCLGVEAVLNLIPKGGYKEIAESTSTGPDKGKGKQRAESEAPRATSPIEPIAGPSRLPELRGQLVDPIMEENELQIVAEHPDEAIDAMDTQPPLLRYGADGVAVADANAPASGSRTEGVNHEATEPKQGHDRKKNKVTMRKQKTSGPAISMTLVHGDCLILYGDDFEYQIIRVGTTVLVIGSSEGT